MIKKIILILLILLLLITWREKTTQPGEIIALPGENPIMTGDMAAMNK